MADNNSTDTDDRDIEEEGADRHYFVKVDRTEEKPVVDYFRLGSASDDASYNSTTSVEQQAKASISRDEALGGIENKIGDSGVLLFTSGDRTEFVGDDSFERVVGDSFKIYGEKHEIIDEAHVVSGAAKGLFSDIGMEYSVSRAVEYAAAAAAKLEFSAGVSYGSRLSAGIESKTGIGLGISFGGEVEVAHSVKAEFNAKGEYEAPSAGLNHGETPVYFGEESITLGLDNDPIQGTVKSALKTLAGLLQTGDLAYTANGLATVARLDEFKKNPDEIETHVNAAEIIATTQAAIALIAAVVCGLAGNIQKAKAGALAANIADKPFIRINKQGHGPAATNIITLDTGGGASITLSGDSVTIQATQVNVDTNVAGHLGAIRLRSGTALQMSALQGVSLSANQQTTIRGGQGITLSAPGQTVTSNANQFNQNGGFRANATTLGATTAQTLNVAGTPVATAADLAAVAEQAQTLAVRVSTLVGATAGGMVSAALAGLFG